MKPRTLLVTTVLALAAGCINIPGEDTLFVRGEPFILTGTADVLQRWGQPCPVWIGENGITYHLFQGPRLSNEEYDAIAAPGVTSRLEVATRSDLAVQCQVGTIVEVQRILEIVP